MDKDHDAMIIFLAEPEVVVTDDVGAKVFLALDMSRFEGNIGTLQKKHRQMIEKASEEISVADAAMWSGLRSAKYRNPMGCRTFLFELFAGMMLLSATVATARRAEVTALSHKHSPVLVGVREPQYRAGESGGAGQSAASQQRHQRR